MQSEIVIVYVCPNCENYYGASDMGDLVNTWNTNLKRERTHNRARCPNCHAQRERRYARLITQDEIRQEAAS